MQTNWYYRNRNGYKGTVDQDSESEIRELLIGRKIIEIENDDTFVLDNGMKLKVEPNEGCGGCSSGWYEINHIASVNNAITNVEFDVEEDANYDSWDTWGDTHYKIFVIADGIQTELLDVYGTDGNGYYGTGYEIHVFVPESE